MAKFVAVGLAVGTVTLVVDVVAVPFLAVAEVVVSLAAVAFLAVVGVAVAFLVAEAVVEDVEDIRQ